MNKSTKLEPEIKEPTEEEIKAEEERIRQE